MRRSPLVRRTPLRTKAPASRPSPSGPDRLTVDAVLERDCWSCVLCGTGVTGERGRDWSIHHRRPRAMGGTDRLDSNSPANLLTVCGSGTSGCHGVIESHRAAAYNAGWLLHQGDDPTRLAVLVDRRSRWVYLTADAGMSATPPGGER